MKRVLVASHVSQVYAPTYPLIRFLKNKSVDLICILHPFTESGITTTKLEVYQGERLVKRKEVRLLGKVFWINFLRDFLITLFYSFLNIKNFDVFIGVNSLNTLPGLIIKFFSPKKRIVYYSADYSPKRFKNPLFNQFYLWLDKFCSQKADFTWSVSERIREVKKSFGVSERKNILVPNGVHLVDIKKKDISLVKKNSLVYVGHLTKTKGVQDIILGFRKALVYNKRLTLKIIGKGPYEKRLKSLVKKEKLSKQVKFLGALTNKQVLELISRCAVGLAPYNLSEAYTYYCDPVKVKEYLAVGCPVIISDVPHVAHLIKKESCGEVIGNFKEDLVKAIETILGSEKKYIAYRKQAMAVGKRFDWDRIYTQAFNEIKI